MMMTCPISLHDDAIHVSNHCKGLKMTGLPVSGAPPPPPPPPPLCPAVISPHIANISACVPTQQCARAFTPSLFTCSRYKGVETTGRQASCPLIKLSIRPQRPHSSPHLPLRQECCPQGRCQDPTPTHQPAWTHLASIPLIISGGRPPSAPSLSGILQWVGLAQMYV